MNNIELLKKYTLASGISGHETEVANLLQEDLKHADEMSKDRMGSIYTTFKGNADDPKIMFIAHMDEIGFVVADMTETGLLKILNVGGWDPNTLLSSPMEIITAAGIHYPGIIGSVPVHFQTNGNGKPTIMAMFVDVGATSKKDLEENFGIALGDPIVPVCNYHYSEKNNRMLSKAFDDRAGVSMLVALGEKLKTLQHPNKVYLVGSVQEEVGARGAQSIANYTDADICIVLEGAPADDMPGIPGTPQTAVGKGAHVRLFDPTLIVRKELRDFVVNTAKKHNIKHQATVRRGGGTDGKVMHTAAHGIPTIVLGIPVRYAHSHNCLSSLDDFNDTVDLITKICEDFTAEELAKF